jgi:hypothetical protein
MSCPYFSPVRRSNASGGPCGGAMLPLGDQWVGVCQSPEFAPEEPDGAVLRGLCNSGYARRGCSRFPAGDGPDAVRFAIWRDDGASIWVRFAIERDHHPFEHGTLEYARGSASFQAPPASGLLERQARAYIESYVRRKGGRDSGSASDDACQL